MIPTRRLYLLQKTNSFCPIAELPAEVLIEIFQMTCESTVKTEKPITPLLFGGICKDWREIAWSTPLLWSTVSICVSGRPSQVDLLREWLLRAQSTQLSIYLTLGKECRTRRLPHRRIFELLVTRVEYWQTFDCDLSSQYHDIFHGLEIPSLTSLSFRSITEGCSMSPAVLPAPVTPRLVRLECSGYDLSCCILEAFPLKQIRYFKSDGLSIEITEAFALLRCARALKECRIYVTEGDETPPPMQHTELELLDVQGPLFSFLYNLTLPKLRVLTVDDAECIFEDLLSPISSFITRSSCHLERLSIGQKFPPTDDAILTLLEATPLLTHLHVASHVEYQPTRPSRSLSDKLVSRLRPTRHGPLLLPRLTSLGYQGPVSCSGRVLIDMLSERWHHVSESEGGEMTRLLRAEIVGKSYKYLPRDVRADMDMLVSEGMQLEFRSG